MQNRETKMRKNIYLAHSEDGNTYWSTSDKILENFSKVNSEEVFVYSYIIIVTGPWETYILHESGTLEELYHILKGSCFSSNEECETMIKSYNVKDDSIQYHVAKVLIDEQSGEVVLKEVVGCEKSPLRKFDVNGE